MFRTLLECQPIVSDFYQPTAQPQTLFYYTAFGNCADSTNPLDIFVNFTRMYNIQAYSTSSMHSVTVMVGHSQDISSIIRHTETPVTLNDGMNIVGFAHQHIVRQFRYPGLSVFGLFTVRFLDIYYIICSLFVALSVIRRPRGIRNNPDNFQRSSIHRRYSFAYYLSTDGFFERQDCSRLSRQVDSQRPFGRWWSLDIYCFYFRGFVWKLARTRRVWYVFHEYLIKPTKFSFFLF